LGEWVTLYILSLYAASYSIGITTHAENLHQLSNAIALTTQQNAMGALPHLMMAALPIQALQ
jgi:hypothetical protein